MKEGDRRRFNKGSKEFQANSVPWTSEEARAAQLKGQPKRDALNAARHKIKDKQQFLNDAIEAIVSEDPSVLQDILANVAKHAKGTDRVAMSAASIFMEYSGMKAPKQQEVKVVEKTESIDEVQKELENLGVKLVVNNGKG